MTVTCLLPFLISLFRGDQEGDRVYIYSGGSLYGVYSIYDDRTVNIVSGRGYNTVVIRDGVVSVTESDCPGRDCVNARSISSSGGFIACLPHDLFIVVGDDAETGNSYDGVTY